MKKTYQIPDILPDSIDRDAWIDFVNNRDEIGHPMTPTGAKRIFKKLAPYPKQIQTQALETAAERGYRGVFPQSERIESQGFIEKHTDTSWADELTPANVEKIK